MNELLPAAILFLVLTCAFFWWNRPASHIAAAGRAWRRGDEPGTLAEFLKAHRVGRLGADPTVTLAYLLLKAGRTDEAGTLLETALAGNPKKKPLKEADRQLLETYRSLVLWKRGQVTQAVGLLEGLLAAGYRTAALYGNLGFFLLETGDLARAEVLCREAVEWDPQGKVLLDNLGSYYRAAGIWDKASETYAKLLDLDPVFPEAWYGAGVVSLRTGDPAEARRRWTRALELPFHALTTVERSAVDRALSVGTP